MDSTKTEQGITKETMKIKETDLLQVNEAATQQKPTDVSELLESPGGSAEAAAEALSKVTIDPKIFKEMESTFDNLKASSKGHRKPSKDGIKMNRDDAPVDEDKAASKKEFKEMLNTESYLSKLKEESAILPESMLRLLTIESLCFFYGKNLEDAHTCLDAWMMGEDVKDVVKYKTPSGNSIEIGVVVTDPLQNAHKDIELQEFINSRFSSRKIIDSVLKQLTPIIYDIEYINKKREDGKEPLTTIDDIYNYLSKVKEPFLKKIKSDISSLKLFYLCLASNPNSYESF